MRHLILFTFLLFSSHAVAAENGAALPAGATLLNISATETVEVEQDELVATLRVEKRLADSRELQQDINMMMKKATEEAKKFEGLDISTHQYYVHEYNTKTQKLWQGSQTLSIKSKNAEDVLELTGRLQDMGFVMNGLNYTLSREKHEEVRDSLLEAAIKKLSERARRVGSAIDKPNVDLWEVNVDAAPTNIYPQPMMARGMMMGATAELASAAPVAQAGKNQISMTVSAKVILK